MADTKKKDTPLMQQYNAIKAKYPDALLLFRVGDFYETFGSDAIRASRILGIVLTKRNNGSDGKQELAGFPHHSLDVYLPKLVRAGLRVAICDQLEDPKLTKTIVKRGVTELVTPGVTFNDKVLENKSNNFLAAVHIDKNDAGVAFLDVSTGEFLIAQGNVQYIDKILQGFKPNEVLYQKQRSSEFVENFGDRYYSYKLEDWTFTPEFGEEILLKHFKTASLKGFGIENHTLGIIAAGVILHYLGETQHDKLGHITRIARIEEDHFVWLDRFTIRNLELIVPANENATALIDVLDHTVSPMGGRMLKRWIVMPLKEKQPIEDRLGAVEFLVKERTIADQLSSHIENVGDLERLVSKAAVSRISPRELLFLKRALTSLPLIKDTLASSACHSLVRMADRIHLCTALLERIQRELHDEAPAAVNKGNVIKEGVNDELDELRRILYGGKEYLNEIQKRESERTGIPSLKIAFNNVFGYYLEVSNVHKNKVPPEWLRRQTLSNAERYITEELKEYETKILGAEEKILGLETRLFTDLVLAVHEYIQPIQHNAMVTAQADCLVSFATAAVRNRYNRPEMNEGYKLEILQGRHPVIEKTLPEGQPYIANDLMLDPETQQIIMITGPNMSGKSAILRQTALITLMAQMGSFVPAEKAVIGLVDKVFTRVGASDNLSSGESTFMVEMNEMASILNNLSGRSLVLLDEIGRGTSTYDGISIAWAIAEYMHDHPGFKAKTLFATHYHELNDMARSFARIKNYNVAVKETGNKVLFLRKLVPGGSEHSFGIHVARMAGIPTEVVKRSEQILKNLEKNREGGMQRSNDKKSSKKEVQEVDTEMQLSFFQLDDPILIELRDQIKDIDINSLTPVEALLKLNEIKKRLTGGED
ncbi:MAG: DNA mismatch repair protein MutS [Flavobacteriales bacterium]